MIHIKLLLFIASLQKVCELGPGDTFGELSQILQNDKRRSASMICRGYSEFLRIDRGDFIEVSELGTLIKKNQKASTMSSHFAETV